MRNMMYRTMGILEWAGFTADQLQEILDEFEKETGKTPTKIYIQRPHFNGIPMEFHDKPGVRIK